ncbi:SOS response-associated peptidase [Rhodohalobacter sp. 614A]|uniref:SOS response-associated peptidase n=1 Tax=Rhodohalobacter sp. 614A TaxID=2908649 RepID=UPI001F459A5B|nr:SOS response-associated peptidase family protein [Rhodohalobacter sp. 614A]
MAKRVAFFASKEEIENYYNIQTKKESLFEAHYNLSPGHQLPVITIANGEPQIERLRWGKSGTSGAKETTIEKENLLDRLKEKDATRCILPLSGFYIWKDNQEKNNPFFVRLLNDAVASIAGIYISGEEDYVSIVTTESNTLVQPMSARMPLLLDQPTALQWLEKGIDLAELLSRTDNIFTLTDLTVLRVSKKVNDPSNNSPKLIQPIPK